MKNINRALVALCMVFFNVSNIAFAEPIEDNSFLMEEAYNQEDGVVQFINSYQYMKASKEWGYLFVNEIPIGGQVHQFSYSVPYGRGETERKGIGDVLLNYRYQLMNEDKVSVAPRLSLILPTGKYQNNLGQGSFGLQFNNSLSLKISNEFVNHWNIGTTWVPWAKNMIGAEASNLSFNYGTSFIYLINDNINFLAEFVGSTTETTVGSEQISRDDSFFIVPGVRYAFNTKNWQIVPGIGFPVGVGPSKHDNGILLYLSFEGKMF